MKNENKIFNVFNKEKFSEFKNNYFFPLFKRSQNFSTD